MTATSSVRGNRLPITDRESSAATREAAHGLGRNGRSLPENDRRPAVRPWLLATAATLAVWFFFSWPLPRHLVSGIPATAQNTERQTVRHMIAGDHLQLLYHFRLAGEMAAGRLPLFHNPYEFHTGDDAERFEPNAYYVPFSLIHAALAGLAGQAFGWNMTGLISLFATLFFSWRLAQRYVPGAPAAGAAAVIGILLPYRWVALLGGSPTGFAMALVPMSLLGLDRAVRDGSPRGGALAGFALLLAFCGDLHTFFFSVLAAPVWCIVALVAGELPAHRVDSSRTDEEAAPSVGSIARAARRAAGRIVPALLPTLLFAVGAYLLSRFTARDLAGATMDGGWTLREIAPYSPRPADLAAWTGGPPVGVIYVGWIVSLTILAGLAILARRAARRGPGAGRTLFVLLLLCAAIGGTIILALGTHGPGDGWPLRACRVLIPPYRMIRQPAKIFCLLPSLLSVAGAVALAALTGTASSAAPPTRARAILGRTICLSVCGLLFLEYGLPIRSAISLLDTTQGAYSAVAADAARRDRAPHAIVIPLWPGDSHWSSLYLHNAVSYRIRLMNGYRPAVPKHYFDGVFKRFESINQGILTGVQLDDLLARGCDYVLLHEDAFPEKVSPFPVHLTLSRLLAHPRLALLAQDERVRSFRILPAPGRPAAAADGRPSDIPYLFPARQWRIEAAVVAELVFAPRAPIGHAPDLRWSLLARGRGALDYRQGLDNEPMQTGRLTVASGERWEWHDLAIDPPSPFFTPNLAVAPAGGSVELRVCVLTAGPKPRPAPGASLEIPAPLFFHAGYSDANLRTVAFARTKEPARPILYGSLIDLPDGRYRLTAAAHTAAPQGSRLGRLQALDGARVVAAREVVSGAPAVLEFAQNNSLPLRIEFCYSALHDLRLGTFSLTRLPDEDER